MEKNELGFWFRLGLLQQRPWRAHLHQALAVYSRPLEGLADRKIDEVAAHWRRGRARGFAGDASSG